MHTMVILGKGFLSNYHIEFGFGIEGELFRGLVRL